MKSLTRHLRCLALAISASIAIVAGALSASLTLAALAPAHAQVSAEFQAALEPYGSWQLHPRFGEVWVPYDVPPGWRPYTYGRWVYTDEWGWYWVSDPEEADWGWVAFHYGRWAHDRRLGWFWIPGDEWGPAWVDWRRGDDYVGWAPLPPEEIIYEYDNNPAYWIFLPPRYLVAPRVRTYFLPPRRTVVVFRQTVIVNRTVRLEHHDRRARFAVNPGIAPGIVAAAARRPIQTFHVQPRVLASTQGVAGAVQVRPQDLSRQRYQRGQPRPRGPSPVQATLQPTQTVVQPVARVPQAQPLRNDERGRLGPTPPRAAQGATVAPTPGPGSSPQPSVAPRQPNGPPPSGPAVQQPGSTPPAATSPPATSPQTATPPPGAPPPQPQRRDASPPPGPPPPTGSPPPQQPAIVRPISPQSTPPATTAPPPQQLQRRDVSPPPGPPPGPPSGPPPGPPRGAGSPPAQQPAIVRPIPPQSTPPSAPQPPPQQQLRGPPPGGPPPQERRVQPPPPQPHVQPPPQPRQVQPQPPPQPQVQPPAPPRVAPAAPPPAAQQQKRPPPKPGEKPAEQPK